MNLQNAFWDNNFYKIMNVNDVKQAIIHLKKNLLNLKYAKNVQILKIFCAMEDQIWFQKKDIGTSLNLAFKYFLWIIYL